MFHPPSLLSFLFFFLHHWQGSSHWFDLSYFVSCCACFLVSGSWFSHIHFWKTWATKHIIGTRRKLYESCRSKYKLPEIVRAPCGMPQRPETEITFDCTSRAKGLSLAFSRPLPALEECHILRQMLETWHIFWGLFWRFWNESKLGTMREVRRAGAGLCPIKPNLFFLEKLSQ